MSLVDYILNNIEKKIKGEPCIHYALQGAGAQDVLRDAYQKASKKFKDKNNKFILISQAITPSLFISKILNNDTDTMDNLMAKLEDKTKGNYFVFVQDFDRIMSAIDKEHKLGFHLVSINHLYLTISATSNPETVGILNKMNSPYWLDSYFRFVQVK